MTEQYYNNTDLWVNGSLSLKDILDDIELQKHDEDSLFKNASRTLLSVIARRGLRDLDYAYKHSVRAVRFTVPENLIMPFPEDYDTLVRASLIDKCNNLTEIEINTQVPAYVVTYMQNCGGELLFDCNGDVYDLTGNICSSDNCEDNCYVCKCTAKEHHKGWVTEQDGYFAFDPELEDKDVFIEYSSNGIETLDDCSVRIKNGYSEALTNYIKWKYLEDRFNTQNRASYYQNLYILEQNKIVAKGLDKKSIDIDKIISIMDLRFNY